MTLSHMFPHPAQPILGAFVHEQVKYLRKFCNIDARVLVDRPYWSHKYRHPISAYKWNAGCYSKFHDAGIWHELDDVPVMYVPYRVIPNCFWLQGLFYKNALCRNIGKIYESFKFKLIHAHTPFLDGTAGRFMAEQFNVPMLITEHTGPFSYLTRHPVIRRYTCKALNAAARVISFSKFQHSNVTAYIQQRKYAVNNFGFQEISYKINAVYEDILKTNR